MYRTLWFLLVLLGPNYLPAQLVIDTTMSPKEMVEEVLVGNRIRVNNVRVRGKRFSYGVFEDQSIKPLIGKGLIFTTGQVFDMVGPNKRASTGRNVNGQGDRALFYLADGPTFDATGIEFDFIPEYENIVFNYFFGSEEYTEYVNSQFNDVFAFFITGPGYPRNTNLAVLPGRKTPITINTIHPGKNKEFYIDNNVFNPKGYRLEKLEANVDSVWVNNFELDGFTKLMQIEARVEPGKVYHIKIVIADVNDGAYDSAVFLEGKSFTSLPSDPLDREEIVMREANQFRRAFEPGKLGERPPKPGPVLLELARSGMEAVDREMEELEEKEEPDNEEKEEVGEETEKTSTSTEVKGLELALVVGFDLDSDALTASEKKALRELIPQIKAQPGRTLLVEGHTCDLGNKAYNTRLSRRRAESVASYLEQQGIPADRLEVLGRDYAEPRAPNSAELNRALNRRVELRWEE